MSSKSESSGGGGGGGGGNGGVKSACIRIMRLLDADHVHATPLSAASHKRCAEIMLSLNVELDEAVLSSDDRSIADSALRIAMLATRRRIGASDEIECANPLWDTLKLLLVLLARMFVDRDAVDDRIEFESYDRMLKCSVLDQMLGASDYVQTLNASNVQRFVLKTTKHRLGEVEALDALELDTAAALFVLYTRDEFLGKLLLELEPVDSNFLTLGAFDFCRSVNADALGSSAASCENLVAAAESEAGQTIFRDLLLSFKLPRGVVGVRNCLILSRRVNADATENFVEIVSESHEAAMKGPAWCFERESDELQKICAVLAGLAISMLAITETVRKNTAFRGRIGLPFLLTEVEAAESHKPKIVLLLPNTWVCYRINSSGAEVLAKGDGLEGFYVCVQAFK